MEMDVLAEIVNVKKSAFSMHIKRTENDHIHITRFGYGYLK